MSSSSQIVRGSVDQTGNGPFPFLKVAQDGSLGVTTGTAAPSGSTTAVNTNSSGARYNTAPPTYTNGQLAENQADGAGNQKVVIASRPGTDRSVTLVANTAQTLMAANTARNGFLISNDTASDVWINTIGAATAAAGGGNKKIAANGGYFELKGVSNAVSIISTGAVAVTALEW